MDAKSFSNKEELHISGTSGKDAIAPLLVEYEKFIAALQQQIEVYKTEHEFLGKELAEVIAENKCLSERMKNILGKKLSEEAVSYPFGKKESDMVANLQQQLSLILQEKESAVELWHLALREVDNVDKHSKSYEDSNVDITNRKMEHLRKDFTEAMTLLEAKLNSTRSTLVKEKADRENIEKKYQRIVEENEALTVRLKSREGELEAALEGQCAMAKKVQEMERMVVDLEKQIAASKEAERELESALSQCHKHIEVLVVRNLEAQDKVSESVHLVECALAEKEAAIITEAKIKEENARLQQMMVSVVEEAGVRVKEETGNIKQQYNGKLKTLLIDMKKLEDECNEKEKKIRHLIEERSILEGQLEQIQKQVPGTEMKLSQVHEEMIEVRRSNLQLAMEKESLHSQIERLQESHAMELRRVGQEYQAMEQKIQAQLQAATNDHIEKLMHQIRLLEQENDRKNLMSRIELQEWQQKQQHQQEYEDLIAQLQKIQKQSDTTASELEQHLVKQHSIKIKYQKAMKGLTEKFEKRIHELRHESDKLKKENKSLEAKLSDIQECLAAERRLSKNDNK